MNLNISPAKAIIGETLAIESNFLEILQNKSIAKEEKLSVWCDVIKKKNVGLIFYLLRERNSGNSGNSGNMADGCAIS